MSEQYNKYLKEHMDNVKKAWKELKHILPVEISSVIDDTAIEIRIEDHDESKYSPLEYPAQDEYFYPKKIDKTQVKFIFKIIKFF